MNNSNRKEIHPGDLIIGNVYDLEIQSWGDRWRNPISLEGERYDNERFQWWEENRDKKDPEEKEPWKNYIYKGSDWDTKKHPHLILYFADETDDGEIFELDWGPLDKIYPSYSSYTLKDQLKESKDPNALSALDKATSGTEDLKKYIGEFGGGKRKRRTRKQKGYNRKSRKRKQKGCKKKKSKRSKK